MRAYLAGRHQRSTLSARIAHVLREHRAWRKMGDVEERLFAAEVAGDDARASELRAEIIAARDRLDDVRRSVP